MKRKATFSSIIYLFVHYISLSYCQLRNNETEKTRHSTLQSWVFPTNMMTGATLHLWEAHMAISQKDHIWVFTYILDAEAEFCTACIVISPISRHTISSGAIKELLNLPTLQHIPKNLRLKLTCLTCNNSTGVNATSWKAALRITENWIWPNGCLINGWLV